MINQQLLDFIKQQLQAGSTKEKISSELLVNGWTTQDIEEGFNAVIPPASTTKPPVSPYAEASYLQKTDPIKTVETQQQTFQPEVQTPPIQSTKSNTILEIHPFIKYGLIIGIIGIIFFITSFLFSNIKKADITTITYLVVLEIFISLIAVFCTMLVAKMLKCGNRTLVKALSAVGVMGFLSGLVYLITLLKLPYLIPSILGLLGLIFILFFLKKIYSISYLRAFFVWFLYGLLTSIVILILFFIVGFSFLFSLFNALQSQNLINNTDMTQQEVIPIQDQTQLVKQNNNLVIPDEQTPNQQTQNFSNYTNPTYKYSFNYPIGWKIEDTYTEYLSITNSDSFPPENLGIYTYVSGYKEIDSENFLKDKNTPYQKENITIAGIPSIKLTFDDNQKIGTKIAHSRSVTLYIPNKGVDGQELIITGKCSTWATSNNEKKCSTAIDDIMDNLVFPSISFKK